MQHTSYTWLGNSSAINSAIRIWCAFSSNISRSLTMFTMPITYNSLCVHVTTSWDDFSVRWNHNSQSKPASRQINTHKSMWQALLDSKLHMKEKNSIYKQEIRVFHIYATKAFFIQIKISTPKRKVRSARPANTTPELTKFRGRSEWIITKLENYKSHRESQCKGNFFYSKQIS